MNRIHNLFCRSDVWRDLTHDRIRPTTSTGSRAAGDARARELLGELQLTHRLDVLPGTLSDVV